MRWTIDIYDPYAVEPEATFVAENDVRAANFIDELTGMGAKTIESDLREDSELRWENPETGVEVLANPQM